MSESLKYTIGIDEAGRGPLAGPVAVGVVKVPSDFDWALLPGVGDSKQLCETKRKAVFALARQAKLAGQLDYTVVMSSAQIIDREGINTTIYRSIAKGLKRVGAYHTINRTIVKLDGRLRAPTEFLNQETIIKGDQKELVIGLASIMAKVTRDRYMYRLCKGYPYTQYGFEKHKGYGTKVHREAIAIHGLSTQHRKTFCKNINFVV